MGALGSRPTQTGLKLMRLQPSLMGTVVVVAEPNVDGLEEHQRAGQAADAAEGNVLGSRMSPRLSKYFGVEGRGGMEPQFGCFFLFFFSVAASQHTAEHTWHRKTVISCCFLLFYISTSVVLCCRFVF